MRTSLIAALAPLLFAGEALCQDPSASRFAPPADVLIRGLEGGVRPAVAIGDIDGDHRRDVVAISRGQLLAATTRAGNQAELVLHPVRLDRANARFRTLCAVRCHPTLVDVNGDGALDIAVAQGTDPGAISSSVGLYWAPGRGDGTFSTPQRFRGVDGEPIPGRTDIGMADLDGDGDPDLIRGGQRIDWFAATASGFDGPRPLGIGGQQPIAVDWDGDGDADILAILDDSEPGPIGWFERTGPGAFADARTLREGRFRSFAVSDWDLDGDLDLVTVHGESHQVIGGPVQQTESERQQQAALDEAMRLANQELQELLDTSPRGLSRDERAQRVARREELLNRMQKIAAALSPLKKRAERELRSRTAFRATRYRVQVHLREP